MEAAQTIEAKKHGLRQSQDGQWTLTLILHPSDTPDWLLTAPMGQRLALVVAALKDEAEKPKERKRFDEMPLSQQCALICADVGFQRWLRNAEDTTWRLAVEVVGQNARTEEVTASVVRSLCVVESRSTLDSDPGAAACWRDLHTRFLTETRRIPEVRG